MISSFPPPFPEIENFSWRTSDLHPGFYCEVLRCLVVTFVWSRKLFSRDRSTCNNSGWSTRCSKSCFKRSFAFRKDVFETLFQWYRTMVLEKGPNEMQTINFVKRPLKWNILGEIPRTNYIMQISFVFFAKLRWEYVHVQGYRLCTFRHDSMERKKQMFQCKLPIYKLKSL